MINYQLFAELKAAIEEKYSSTHEMYCEEPHKTYRNHRIWDNYGIRIVSTNFTIAVLCEYDQNDPDADVYVGVKVLYINNEASQLSQYLNSQNKDGQSRGIDKNFHRRWFSWPYWKTIKSVNDGLILFDKLLSDCNDFLSKKIF